MASPQPDRFVRLSTELLETLMGTKLRGVQFRIVLWVIRHTYGWNRKKTKFSWYRMAEDLGMFRGTVFKAGQKLMRDNVIHVGGGEISIQKDYDRWNRSLFDDEDTPSIPTGGAAGVTESASAESQKALSGGNEKRCLGETPPLPGGNGRRCPQETPPLPGGNESVSAGQPKRCPQETVFIGAKDSIDIDKDISIDTKGASDRPVASHPQNQPPEAPLKGGPLGGGCIDETSTGKKEEKDPAVETMNFYLSFRGQCLDRGKREGFYKQYRDVARGLLKACDGDLEEVKAAISRIGNELKQRRLSWSLSTVYRWFTDPSLMEGGENHRGRHSAGAAHPIPGKYAHLSEG